MFLFTFVFLISNSAFSAFVRDMLSGGGKDPKFFNTPSEVFHVTTPFVPVNLFLIAGLALLYFWNKLKPEFRVQRSVGGQHRVDYFAILFVSSFVLWRFSGGYRAAYLPGFLVFSALLCLLPVAADRYAGRVSFRVKSVFALLIVLVVPFVFDRLFAGESLDLTGGPLVGVGKAFLFVASIGPTQGALISFFLIAILLSSIVLLPRSGRAFMERHHATYFDKTRLTASELRFVLVFANILSLAVFVNVFSSGGGIYVQWFIPQGIVYLAVLLLVFRHISRRLPLVNVVTVALVLSTVSTLAITLNNPYTWFNWTENGVLVADEPVDVPHAAGFQVSAPAHDIYQRIHSSAVRAAQLSGKGKDATVFSFPNIPMAAVSSGLKNYSGTRCIVLWFDTCPNDQAARDLNAFKKNLPSVIIWGPIPYGLVETNERIFVHGHSALQDWEGYRVWAATNGRWRLVDKIQSPQLKNWSIYVYAVVPRKDVVAPDPSLIPQFGS